MEGIFRTNNFALGPLTPHTAHGVFLRISRLNHSCRPNCEVVWRDESKCQQVVAIRDIEDGDELTICYLNMENRMKTAEERKKILRPYGFCCSCRDCAGEEDIQKIRRFQEINMILDGKKETDKNSLAVFREREYSSASWRKTCLENIYSRDCCGCVLREGYLQNVGKTNKISQ